MKIGFTTSIPVEIIFAANHEPVDMNNIFVTGNAEALVEQAEFAGFPRNCCAWIKGLYSVALKEEFDAVIGVAEGDCSNTHSLMSILQDKDINVIPFSYPFDHKKEKLQTELEKLRDFFHVDWQTITDMKTKLDKIREKLIILDKMTYKNAIVSGEENHLWLVNSSDFNGNFQLFEHKLDIFLEEVSQRKPLDFEIRLAYLGVPPIYPDLYSFLLEQKANVVYNEIQRQFSMPYLEKDITNQYLRYTYPYSVFQRLEDIQTEIKVRQIDGIISYAQSFCHRQIDHIILKKYIDLPVLTIEGDGPGLLDARTKLRIESFLDMLRYR
jgi:benzoyl-CoA reductase/2-hydroxyglutaryl-CoA dehydratase subunit BcrC/BadD/HgdB